MLILGSAACGPATGEPVGLPTFMPLPTLPTLIATLPQESPQPAPSATQAATTTEAVAPSPSATLTLNPARTPVPIASPSPAPSATPQPLIPSATHTPLPDSFIFGTSAGGRDLLAYRVGTGGRTIMLVGGVHAGFEANTIRLIEEMLRHFQDRPQDLLPGITLLFVPVLNPDGYARGRQLSGRFNGNNVDLNRNWACGWSSEAQFGNGTVNPGDAPFSEPETLALGALIQQVQPAAVLFYHSAARGVFAGNCEASISAAMAAVYGEASGYPYGEAFGAYPVTGSAPAWVDSQNIPAADVELATADDTELLRNLNGVMALQSWALAQP